MWQRLTNYSQKSTSCGIDCMTDIQSAYVGLELMFTCADFLKHSQSYPPTKGERLMFRSTILIQYAVILAISFVSGVICFQAFALDKSVQLIELIDSRVINPYNVSFWQTIFPLLVSIALVLLFATHPFVTFVAQFVVAVRATFFGFSSVFLLTQQDSMAVYSIWWFPFQLVYCILLLVLCSVYTSRKVGNNRKYFFASNLFITLLAIFAGICALEIAVISYFL